MPNMETQNSNVSRAEEIKVLANEAFKAHKYGQAIDLYSQAIELNGDNAVYWANRAFAHSKLEEYGSAILDASKAGYYRRGAAYLAMGKFKDALKDFQQVKKICPNDPDASKKLKECEKAVMKLKFEEAIAVPESQRRSVADSIDFHSIGTSPSSSSMPTQVAIAPVAVAVVAAGAMLVGTAKPVVVVAVLMVVLVVLGAYLWGSCRGSGVFTKRGIMDLDVEPQYSGARIEGDIVTLDFVKKMMDDFKNQKCLHKRYAFQMVLQTREILQALPSLVDINVPEGKHFTVCGDVHGQFYDLLNIFELNGFPSEENPYLFNGDFVDRGSFSLEVILTLFAFKCMCPSAIYLSRGNHESKSMNKIYGFEGEVRSKLSETFVELFAEVFCCLPLAHVINGKVFVVHGGLFSVDGVKLSDIKAIDRFCEPPEEGLMCELLWSDPQPFPGRGPSKRGVGLSFGKDVTQRFLQDNNLDLVVRSHEVKDEGYEIEHDGKLITVFSAPNYCDQMGNKGAFIRFEAPDLKPNIVTFSAVPHPNVKPMAYANNFLRMPVIGETSTGMDVGAIVKRMTSFVHCFHFSIVSCSVTQVHAFRSSDSDYEPPVTKENAAITSGYLLCTYIYWLLVREHACAPRVLCDRSETLVQ
ncbi:serine/threonine-protein phosphatase 5 isoform X1 [Populus alba x Populus x berolinensis]|nr:serine/threonine-protein phosphatase 5 isoform X1 [Populus alba x Populus x berolinensis]